jgi:hypothetical protein
MYSTKVQRVKRPGYVEQHQVNIQAVALQKRVGTFNVTSFIDKDKAELCAENINSYLTDYNQLRKRGW